MAANEFVLSHPLCFLLTKFGKCQMKLLKSAMVDFYSPEVLSVAKQQLLKDVGTGNISQHVSLPHVPAQRQGENKASRDVDDMFTLLSAIDEADNVYLSDLPTYVADNPDNIPSVRLYESEFGVFVTMLEKLDSRLSLMESAICNVAQDIHSIRSKVAEIEPGVQSIQQRPPGPAQAAQRGVNNNVNTRSADCAAVSGAPGQSVTTTAPMTFGISQSSPVVNGTADQVGDRAAGASTQRTDWASLVSTPLIHSNRFGLLATTDDDEYSDGGRFVEQRSARAKRRRLQSSQQRQQQNQQRQTQQQQNQQQNQQRREDGGDQQQRQQRQQTRRPRAPLMIGKSTARGVSVATAKQIFKKSVFLIDNVSTLHNADDIRSFVSGMSINVISCFEVKPRRRRNEEEGDTDDRKAFRLCIRADDRDRLLDSSKWPSSIAISQWYFKSSQQAVSDAQPRRDGRDDEVCVSAGAAAAGDCPSASTAAVMEHDDDVTPPLDTTAISVCANDGGV